MLLILLRKKQSNSFVGSSMCSTSARLLISCTKKVFSVQLISDFKRSIFDEYHSFRRVRGGTWSELNYYIMMNITDKFSGATPKFEEKTGKSDSDWWGWAHREW